MKPKILTCLTTATLIACAQTDIVPPPEADNEQAQAHAIPVKPSISQPPPAQAEMATRGERLALPAAPTAAKLQSADQRHGAARMMTRAPASPVAAPVQGEGYAHTAENRFQQVALSPLSTFGLDVDSASYSNVRRFLSQGRLPPIDAVRIEELINYFDYDFATPPGVHPLSVTTQMSAAPWNPAHQLLMVGVSARDLAAEQRPANRLVFLLDTSGSMNSPSKLPLLKRSFQILVEQLRPQDSVAIVAYAGSAGLVLPPTSGQHKEAIYAALNRLNAGGSTAGGQGLALAYQVAAQQFLDQANNRVILATDGDFNVGQSSEGELIRMIEARRDKGVFLSVLGFGSGNYQDAKMQQLSSHGNGTHHYIDTDREAERVFRHKLQGTLYTVAKDAKIQIEWNPQTVAGYRLVGYENRLLNAEDFSDDRKDSGDVGAGHSITVLYEIVPANGHEAETALRYQQASSAPGRGDELGLVKLRYKAPQATRSTELSHVIAAQQSSGEQLAWAAGVAEFGLLLRHSEFRAQASFDAVLSRLEAMTGGDPLRQEMVGLVRQAKVASQSQLGLNQPGRIDPRE